MDRPFIERLKIVNYGCIRDLELALTPLHAFIGPNDSGKTTILEAVRTVTTLAAPSMQRWWSTEEGSLLHGRLFAGTPNGNVKISTTVGELEWTVEIEKGSLVEIFSNQATGIDTGSGSAFVRTSEPLSAALLGSQLLRLDPDALRTASELIQKDHPVQLSSSRGAGLPAVYDALVARNLDAFIAIRERLKVLFPTIAVLDFRNPSTTTKTLGVTLLDGTSVPAELMSEGMLYFLAFAALPYLRSTAVILVEQPENGLHPTRVAEVMGVLREVSKTTQVLIATHSPLVVNELGADEITVLTRDPVKGTRAVLLKDTPGYAERSKVYFNGELWLSYADGDQEAPLLEGGPIP